MAFVRTRDRSRQNGSTAAVPVSPLPSAPLSGAPSRRSPAKRQRRPALVALAVALTVIGALGVLWLVSSSSDRSPVLAVAQPVAVGEVIEAGDLVAAQVGVDPALSPVSATELDRVVGLRAAVPLLPGGLLLADQVTPTLVPGSGEQLVAVALPGSRLTIEPLRAGDSVLIVITPQANGEPPSTAPDGIAAVVHAVGGADARTGLVTLDLLVDEADGPMLAAVAATGRVAVILQPRGED